jgi:hypothetical protein
MLFPDRPKIKQNSIECAFALDLCVTLRQLGLIENIRTSYTKRTTWVPILALRDQLSNRLIKDKG